MTHRHFFSLPFFVMLLAAGGCAQLEWQKPGAAAADVARDHDQCAAQARREAWLRMPLAQIPVPQVIMDHQGRSIPAYSNSSRPDSERFFLEQDLIRNCMAAAGYTLQPAPKQPEQK